MEKVLQVRLNWVFQLHLTRNWQWPACLEELMDINIGWLMQDCQFAIPVGAVTLTSVSGGLAYHMSGEKTAAELIEDAKDGGSNIKWRKFNGLYSKPKYGDHF